MNMERKSLAESHPRLAEQWDREKNGIWTPEQATAGMSRKAWWRCKKGHSWQASIASRASGCGCPVCAGRVTVAGYNDLATTFPAVAAQWHPTRNGDLTPERVGPNYGKKVWWRCPKGHDYQAPVKARTVLKSGCPYCSNYLPLPGINDLATVYPELAAQWHPTLNGTLTPDSIVAGSNRIVWWQCGKGHAWRAKVVDRTRHSHGCPYCANRLVLAGFNDLATTRPEVAAQWHPTMNGTLTPEQVTAGSSRRIWWQCPEGHVWRTAICNRAGRNKATGCPVCAGNYRVAYRQELYREAQLPASGEQTGDDGAKPATENAGP